MLISMTPNEEVKTIHASLNDGSLRKWEFEPYTEQGKIELTDQDYATIQSIKGNTVKFNQLVQNGNFADTSNWITEYTTFSVSNNVVSVVGTRNGNNYILQNYQGGGIGHKYFFRVDYYTPDAQDNILIAVYTGSTSDRMNFAPTEYGKWLTYKGILDNHATETTQYQIRLQSRKQNVANQFRNCMLIDLTNIFGSGNEPATPEAFESWLSQNLGLLPYYAYTPGTLIPFNGTGLKTTGKNLLNDTYESGDFTFYLPPGTYYYRRFLLTSKSDISTRLQAEINGTYTYLQDTDSADGGGIITSGNMGWGIDARQTITLTRGYYFRLGSNIITNIIPGIAHLMLCTGSYADEYEPYTSNTLSLPISTYFPTGMKEAGTVYDEISDKAYTRVGSVDLESLNWNYNSGANRFYATKPNDAVYNGSVSTTPNAISSYFTTTYPTGTYQSNNDRLITLLENYIFAVDKQYGSDTTSFKQAMSGVMLYYELATPTSQDISLDLTYPIWDNGTEQILPVNSSTPTTSPMAATIEYPDRTEEVDFLYKQTTFESAIPQFSLVCKNQELPMTLEDGKLICECDSSITNESGFFDAKVKMQDLDSVAYSQKIQLHVERGIND